MDQTSHTQFTPDGDAEANASRHTPTPWYVSPATYSEIFGNTDPQIRTEPQTGLGSNGNLVATIDGANYRDDAEFIVAAVNNHDALVEACRAANDWLNLFGANSPIIFGGEAELSNLLTDALAGLTAAGSAVTE